MHEPNETIEKTRTLALIPAGIALNLALGTIVSALKLPIYLDAVGTITVTILAGLRAGVLVGVSSFVIGGMILNPVLIWFVGTQACIAIATHVMGIRGWFALGALDLPAPLWRRALTHFRPVLAGISLGVVAGVASAPVIAALFGGVTGSGASLVVAFLLKSGKTLFDAVLLSGLASEPLDKTAQVLVSLALLRSLPDHLKRQFGGGCLRQNGLLFSSEHDGLG